MVNKHVNTHWSSAVKHKPTLFPTLKYLDTEEYWPGSSWYVSVRNLLIKNDLPDDWRLLDDPPTKYRWKKMVNKHVNTHWSSAVKHKATLFPTLKYLNTEEYWPGKQLWLIQDVGGVRDLSRIHTKLKLVTGTYILQTSRASFNHLQVDPICLLCQGEAETVEHFLLTCSGLDAVRQPVLDDLAKIYGDLLSGPATTSTQLILDCSGLINSTIAFNQHTQVTEFEKKTKRLCYSLHTERYKRLAVIPNHSRKRKGKGVPQHTTAWSCLF